MVKRSMFVGMDVHKESIDISLADEGRDGEVRHYGVIAGDLEALAKVVRAVRAPGRRLRFVYEAGPCGFGIHRYLTAQGEDCVVVNPSSMPKRSGDRIKTDRRDGNTLARLHRAGELTAIYIPTADDEALRDLVRAREDAVGLSTQAKHRLKAFLLRQGRRYSGRAGWTLPYRRWLADLSFPLAPQHIALQEYRDTIDETERRVERLTDQLRQLTPAWRWAPVVDALQALRGVSFVTAVGLVAEVGDMRRFTHPRELLAYLGLVPSEYSSGPNVAAHLRHARIDDSTAREGPARAGPGAFRCSGVLADIRVRSGDMGNTFSHTRAEVLGCRGRRRYSWINGCNSSRTTSATCSTSRSWRGATASVGKPPTRGSTATMSGDQPGWSIGHGAPRRVRTKRPRRSSRPCWRYAATIRRGVPRSS